MDHLLNGRHSVFLFFYLKKVKKKNIWDEPGENHMLEFGSQEKGWRIDLYVAIFVNWGSVEMYRIKSISNTVVN